jgi:hypothetical protein
MKTITLLFLAGSLLASLAVRADPLDDLIAAMRAGTDGDVTPDQRQEILSGPRKQAAADYRLALAALYVSSVKAAIVHPQQHGGWPYRSSFLADPGTRQALAQGLKDKFEAEPDSVLAYAMLCPARFTRDDVWFGSAMAYLKENDGFLFDLAQKELATWQPYIAERLAAEDAAKRAREAAQPK